MTAFSLQQAIDRSGGNPARMLRSDPRGPYQFPIPQVEYANWRDEQRVWRESAILFDQSFHMSDVYFRGPDTKRLFSDVGVNSFTTFGKNKAKQFVAVNPRGLFIGDAILFGLDEDEYVLVGAPVAANWVQFHAETGDYEVEVTRDEASTINPRERLLFRYQIQGPSALEIVESASGARLDRIKFFNIGEFEIAGVPVRALNHTMVGTPGQEHTGLEIFGPREHSARVKDALLEAGTRFGMREGGALSYPTTSNESGWIARPLPAIYTGDDLKAYREYLPGEGFEAHASLAGSFVSDSIEDYYLTPYDLGYGRVVRFDHDRCRTDPPEGVARVGRGGHRPRDHEQPVRGRSGSQVPRVADRRVLAHPLRPGTARRCGRRARDGPDVHGQPRARRLLGDRRRGARRGRTAADARVGG
jgi:glycine cleavage system aminomethyltransferase T